MFNRSRAMLTGVLAMLSVSAAQAAIPMQRAATVITESKKQLRGLFNGAVLPSSPSLRGISSIRITMAQSKRASVKRHNQRRHKRHIRG